VSIDLTPKNIIFNKPHPAILLRINDKLVRNVVLIFIQEVKRDIFFRRMQLKKPQRQEVLMISIQAHILPVLQKLTALLEYQGIVENSAPISFLSLLQETAMSLNPVFKFTDCLLVPVPAESANTHTSISYPSHTVSLLLLPPTRNYSMQNCYQLVYFCNTGSYNNTCLFLNSLPCIDPPCTVRSSGQGGGAVSWQAEIHYLQNYSLSICITKSPSQSRETVP
jgi:hypothetical protein